MRFFALFITIELTCAFLLVNVPIGKSRSVLGFSLIAQVEEPSPSPDASQQLSPPSASEAEQPTPEQVPQPTTESDVSPPKEPILLPVNPSPGDQSSASEAISSSNSSVSATEETFLLDQIITSPTPSVAEQNNNAPSQLSSEEQPLQVLRTMSLLNSSELISTPENISEASVEEAQREDEKLAKAQTPSEQAALLIDFAQDKVKDIDTFLRTDDFASTHFAAERFTQDITLAIETIQNMPLSQSFAFKAKLGNLCRRADFILRSAELTVPEESEQDIEISRGTCLTAQP